MSLIEAINGPRKATPARFRAPPSGALAMRLDHLLRHLLADYAGAACGSDSRL
jgi:hypothetical protein